MKKPKKSKFGTATILGPMPPKRPDPKNETIFLVLVDRDCRYSMNRVTSVAGAYKTKEVADFRANGAMLMAEKGSTDSFYVRQVEMACEETPQEFLAARLG